jgi:hypothetical protein
MTDAARDIRAMTVAWPSADAAGPMGLALEALRRLVERSTTGRSEPVTVPTAVEAYRGEIDALLDRPQCWWALARLLAVLRLSVFDRDLLLLCAAAQLDPALLAGLPGSAPAGSPTFGLAFVLFGETAWASLAPSAPLQRYRLVAAEARDFLVRAPLRIDDGVFVHLLGATTFDARVADLVEWIRPGAFLPPTHARVAERIAAIWSDRQRDGQIIQLCGTDPTAPRPIAADACARLGVSLASLRGGDVPASATDRAGLARLWEREHAMSGSVLLIDLTDEGPESSRPALELAEVVEAPLVLATREPASLRRVNTTRLEIERPPTREQIEVWRHALPDVDCPPEVLEPLVSQFQSSSATVEAVASALRGTIGPHTPAAHLGRALHDACRIASRRRLDSLAARVSSSPGWDDLVLPPHTMKSLREIVAQLRHRARVYEGWGFADAGDRGLGISALFHGDSGTGKTLAAEVIAHELSLDLYRVDLSRVVSKYIGETEKNLRRVFDAAEESGAILLFDEADALFGKRSEVKDSHDRYANVEVSYLLSRMETYRGLAILTTNFRQALDQAFSRRIRFMIQFPFPDAAQRAVIWSRAFPPRTPTRDLNPTLLARLAVTGGSIRNIAVAAAFLAADADQPVTPAHVLQAATSEYGKLNKSLTESETRGWA